MKRWISIFLTVLAFVVVMSQTVMAGAYWDKSTSSFSFSSACIGHVEAGTCTPKILINGSFKVKTNQTGWSSIASVKSSTVTVTSPWSPTWDLATSGEVSGSIDGVSVSHTDYN